jgi:hypothetical protein
MAKILHSDYFIRKFHRNEDPGNSDFIVTQRCSQKFFNRGTTKNFVWKKNYGGKGDFGGFFS